MRISCSAKEREQCWLKHADHHKSAPGKEAMTAERYTWDLADGLQFIKFNMDKLAKSSAITAFAGPNKENPSLCRPIEAEPDECIDDRHAYAHVMLRQCEAAVLDKEVGEWIGHGPRLASCLAMMVTKYSKLQPNGGGRKPPRRPLRLPLTALVGKSRRLQVCPAVFGSKLQCTAHGSLVDDGQSCEIDEPMAKAKIAKVRHTRAAKEIELATIRIHAEIDRPTPAVASRGDETPRPSQALQREVLSYVGGKRGI
ncbi:hypothetical protein BDZ88DRAFT_288145 [Geranomyces variabilis]|nr:hypothetical protein BDZ88DRAFT_288145 [Geranomyces variabilis]